MVGGHEWQGPATVLRTVMPDLATYSTRSYKPLLHLRHRFLGTLAYSSVLSVPHRTSPHPPRVPSTPLRSHQSLDTGGKIPASAAPKLGDANKSSLKAADHTPWLTDSDVLYSS
ncbi:hypothetical protein E2C01_085460 [Portunus trituberculatus]|uniref:Uncharacterized protein n=1 Tax=Portunus trituberculatus TaxID=210409 RepID=A0A5B7J2S1_PORTR|nr:hypothetical protein [Portunus trituberculatus]